MVPHTKIKSLLSFILISFFFFTSCTKDSDLFTEAVQKNIEETIEERQSEDSSEEEEEEPADNEDSETEETGSNIDDSDFDFTSREKYYVTINGSSSNDGRSESSSWSIEHAFDSARPGDVIFIKAGNYGFHNLIVKNSGTQQDPIFFVGYKNTPGDINANQGPTITWDDYKANGDNLFPDEMPLLQGNRSQAPRFTQNKTAIRVWNVDNIVIKNIQIRNYQDGIWVHNSDNSIFDNIINSDNGYFADFTQGILDPNLLGSGIILYGKCNNSLIKNNMVANVAFRGLGIMDDSHYNTIEWSDVRSDKEKEENPTDYFIFIISGVDGDFATHNKIRNSNVERLKHTAIGGHGYDLNTNTRFNVIEDCTAYNLAFHAHGIFTSDNKIKNVHIQGGGVHPSFQGDFSFVDGAHDNILEDCSIDNALNAVVFSDSGKEKGFLWDDVEDEQAGYNNTIIRLTATNLSKSAINMFWYRENSFTNDNVFIDSSFENVPVLFEVYRSNKDFKLENCTVTNVPKLWRNSTSRNQYSLDSSTEFVDCTFTNSEAPLESEYEVSGLIKN